MQTSWFLTSKSFVLSVALHIVVGVILLFSFDFSSKPKPVQKPAVNIVKATSVDKKQVDLEIKRLKEKEDVKKKQQQELEKKAEELKKLRQAEEKKLNEIKKKNEEEQKKRKQEEAKLKKLEQEKKELEKKQKLEEEKKKKAEEERKKLEAEKKKQEEEKKKEAERKRKEEEERKQKELEEALQKQLDAELEAEQAQRDENEIARYTSAIKRSIEDEFNKLGLPEGLSCVILIRILEGGKVAEASIVKSSGNELFDNRAETAVYSASPLPVPEETRLFEQMRNIRFTFEP